jgi:carboxymethylenebutenolidase
MKTVALLAALFLCSTSLYAQEMGGGNHHAPPTPLDTETAELQDWAKQRLSKSTRKQEWVKVKNGTREVNSLIVHPEKKGKTTAVIVIHENQGLTDWVQSLADQVAEAGFLAIAPDMLSGMGPNGGGTSSLPDRNAVGQAFRDLPPDQITADLNAVATFIAKHPNANGKVAVGGFCWGGGQTFRFATNNSSIKAAFVFYGPTPGGQEGPNKEALAKIAAPVYGFYAGNDARINAALPKTIEFMKELNKTFDPVTYEGAGHGFMRAGDAPEPVAPEPKGDKEADDKAAADHQRALTNYKANKKARDEAWVRWKKILSAI